MDSQLRKEVELAISIKKTIPNNSDRLMFFSNGIVSEFAQIYLGSRIKAPDDIIDELLAMIKKNIRYAEHKIDTNPDFVKSCLFKFDDLKQSRPFCNLTDRCVVCNNEMEIAENEKNKVNVCGKCKGD